MSKTATFTFVSAQALSFNGRCPDDTFIDGDGTWFKGRFVRKVPRYKS